MEKHLVMHVHSRSRMRRYGVQSSEKGWVHYHDSCFLLTLVHIRCQVAQKSHLLPFCFKLFKEKPLGRGSPAAIPGQRRQGRSRDKNCRWQEGAGSLKGLRKGAGSRETAQSDVWSRAWGRSLARPLPAFRALGD